RAIHSTFVEEGQARGTVTGLSSHDVDFVIHENRTINTAIVLPLTWNMKENLHAGFLIEHMPVLDMREPSGKAVKAPSFNLPPEVTNLKQAKKYIAEKFGLLPDMVIKLGESYFNYVGLTP